jgi:hypothetical protein
MQTLEQWQPYATVVWPAFVEKFPQFASSPTRFAASNFFRLHKKELLAAGVITRSVCKFSVFYADTTRFDEAAVRCVLRLPLDNV